MKAARLTNKSRLGVPVMLCILEQTAGQRKWLCLTHQLLFGPGTGMLCSGILLTYRQDSCSFRARRLKKQKTHTVNCGKENT